MVGLESVMRSQRKLPPNQRDWLDRPKNQRISASTIAFILGILILVGMIYLAYITPEIVESLMRSILGDNSVFLPGSIYNNTSTTFQINGMTYDTRELVIQFFQTGRVPD
jgi:quinol-cytochrome oxidoreductase complex cytochrome b subunit